MWLTEVVPYAGIRHKQAYLRVFARHALRPPFADRRHAEPALYLRRFILLGGWAISAHAFSFRVWTKWSAFFAVSP
jgi:hypothetical protein